MPTFRPLTQLAQHDGKVYLSKLAKELSARAEERSFPFVELNIKSGTPTWGLLPSLLASLMTLPPSGLVSLGG